MTTSHDPFAIYLPIDRRMALAQGRDGAMPSRDQGTVLFLDISGFTPLTQALITSLGPDRGAEALIGHLNRVYDQLIEVIHRYHGAVIGFSGDAITCWFSGDEALRATTAAVEAQAVMSAMDDVVVEARQAGGESQRFPLSIKVAIARGPARRFLVGVPHLMRLEALAGRTIDQVAQAEQQANRGEIVLAEAVADVLGDGLTPSCWRDADGQRFAVILPQDRATALSAPAAPAPWPVIAEPLPADTAETWLPMAARKRLRTNAFLAEFRPVVALFLRFGGVDYDSDDDAGDALTAYVNWMQQIISRYGGTVLQLTFGDKGSYAYASFGAPIAYADNAVRAVAAMTLCQPPEALGYITPPQIGLASGAMCAGAYGGTQRRVYGVIGHKTNLAARLMMHAAPGAIWCDQVVQQAAAGTWVFQPLPSIQAKGVRGDVAVFAPTGERVQRSTTLIRPQRRIGRDDIFAQMLEKLDVVGASESTALLLVGEAGMGKSHLLGVLAHEALERDFGVLSGAGLSIEQHSPYRAWREPLRALLGLQAERSAEEQQLQIRAHFETHLPDEIERIPLLGAILDLPLKETGWTQELAPELRQESLQGLVISLLRRRAEQSPLCLFLEDAQWFDSLTWELLQQVGRAMEVSLHGLLLVLSLRPQSARSVDAPEAPYHQALEALSRSHMQRLVLRPMPIDELKALIAHELECDADALGAGIESLLRRRAGGNPFFALELLRLMRENGVLQRLETTAGVRWQLADGADALASLPNSIEGLLLARIDQLPPQRQQILKVASVIGQSFPFPLLRHVLRPHPVAASGQLRLQLASLIDDAFAVQDNEESPGEYAFANIATRDVAYRTLLYQQRRALHRAIALWYEGVTSEQADEPGAESIEYADGMTPSVSAARTTIDFETALAAEEVPSAYWPLLLYHWRQAQAPERERRWARRLGEMAAAQYAHAEAVAHLGRALELTSDEAHQTRYELLLLREQVYEHSGDLEAQRRDLKALRQLGPSLSVEAQVQIRLREAHFALLTAAYDDALTAVADAHRQAQATVSPRLEAEALHLWGDIFFKQRDAASALVRFQASLEVAQKHQLQTLEALSLNALGKCYWRTRQSDEGLKRLRQALAQFRALEDLRSEALVLNNIALILGEQDRRDDAVESLTQARSTCLTLGDRRGEALVLGNLGMYALESGAFPDAWEFLERAQVLSREVGARDNEALALLQLGDVAKRIGEYQHARSLLAEALAIYEEIGHPFFPFVVKMVQAECDHYTGAHEQAIAQTKACLEAGVAEMDPHLAAEMSILLARALEASGRLEDGLAALDKAATWCAGDRKIGMHHDAARARLLWRLADLQTSDDTANVDGPKAVDDADDPIALLTPMLPTLLSEDVHDIDGIAEPFEIYLAALEVLQATSHPQAEALALAARRCLDHRTALLDAPRKQAFLERVPHHQALRQRLSSLP